MKKVLLALCAFCVVGSLGVAQAAEGVAGFVYKQAAEPYMSVAQTASYAKKGTAECTSFFGIVALGDCSISTSMKNGKMTQVHHIDTNVTNILGFKKLTVNTYGN